MQNKFPELFKDYKKKRYAQVGETQVDIAKRWGIDPATLSRHANGHVNGMSFKMIDTVCKDLNITPNDLLILEG
jgi:DNA-binding Xre family transcriptional regulator